MKRILGILSVLFFINACDDGELTVVNIDFEDVAIDACDTKEVLYKVDGKRMLVLAIPFETFVNDETLVDTPTEVPISGDVDVIYREYSGTVTEANICPTLPSATPNLLTEWVATSGTIQITSTAITSINSTTGITQITGYKHYIVFKDITFLKPDGTEQTQETYVFGNYITNVSALAFGFDDEAEKSTCSNDNRIFNFNTSEAFILDLADYATLFQSSATTTPRTALISATNKVTYQLYSGTITNAYFCAATLPATPTLDQEWNANAGVGPDVSGIIEVTTTTSSPGFYQHEIHLKKVTMTRGNSSFDLGDDYFYGTIITP